MTDHMMSDAPVLPHGILSPDSSPQASHVYELVRAASELVFLVDPNKRVVYAGQSLSALLGYDPLEVIGHPVAKLVHPNHAAPLEGAIDQVLRGARLGEAELRWPHQSGRGTLPMMVGFSSLGQGDVTEGTMLTARHANTKKAIEAALTFDDQTTISAGETSPMVMFLLDERGRCVWMNAAWAALSGQPVDQAVGLGWLSMVEEGDRDGFRSVAAQAHQRRSGWRQQFRVRSTTNELYWVDAASSPRFATDGSVSGYIVVLADITAEVRARAELNKRTTIVESNANFVVMDERSQRLVYDTDHPGIPLIQTPPVPAMNVAEEARPSLGAIRTDQQAQYLNEIRPAVLNDGVWQAGTPAPRLANSSFGDGLPLDPPGESTVVEQPQEVATFDYRTHRKLPAIPDTTVVPEATVVPDATVVPEATVGYTPDDATGQYETPHGYASAESGLAPFTAEFVSPQAVAPVPVELMAPALLAPVPVELMAPALLAPVMIEPRVLEPAPSPLESPPVSSFSSSGQPVAWNFDAADTTEGPVDGWKGPSWNATPSQDLAGASGTIVQPTQPDQVYVGLVGPSGSVESIASVSDAVLEPTEFEVADMLPAMDPITGLANRALFQERIRLAMHRMAKDGVSVAIMLANIHGYDELRQHVGAKTGDDQLFVIAKRLEATIRQVDTAARIGDSDFAVLGVGWFFPGDVENAAKRFMLKIQEPLPSVGRQAILPASMGIAIAQPDESISTLLRRAQRARKIAYGLGAGRVYVDNGPGREPTQS